MCNRCAGVYKKVWLKELVWKDASSPVTQETLQQLLQQGLVDPADPAGHFLQFLHTHSLPLPSQSFHPSLASLILSLLLHTFPFPQVPSLCCHFQEDLTLTLPHFPKLASVDYDFIYRARCLIHLSLCVFLSFHESSNIWEIRYQFLHKFVITAEDSGESIELVQLLEMVWPQRHSSTFQAVTFEKQRWFCLWKLVQGRVTVTASEIWTHLFCKLMSSNSASLFLAKYTPCCFSPTWF